MIELLAFAVGACPRTACRPARAEVGHDVVVAGVGALQVDGADRDDARLVAGRADRAPALAAVRVKAVVAGRDDHHDAVGDGAANGACQRVGTVGFGGVRTQAQVHHLDVQPAGVVDDPIDAGQHVRELTRAIAVEHAHIKQVGVGRHARAVGRLEGAAARGHRGHVCAVAVRVGPGCPGAAHRVLVHPGARAGRVQGVRHVDAGRPVGRTGTKV